MAEPKQSLSDGELVAGNYRILGVAGSGGMGVVYRALDLRLERVVALKFLPAELNTSLPDKQRFLREARTASSLDHPNIGVIHGVEETSDGQAFIVMAFYEGASLAQYISRGALPEHQAIDIASQIARGLAEAHSRNIVHRDIKPSNVMLTASGSVKIVDFGLAHMVSAQTASLAGISGTVAYMSPEQALGHQVDQRCDIWSLGVVLAEMLTGTNPFYGDTVPSVLFSVLNQAPRNIESLHPALQPIIYRALTKDADRRYASCAELLVDLDRADRTIQTPGKSARNAAPRLPAIVSRSGRVAAHTRRARKDASRSAWMPAASQRSPLAVPLLGAALLLPLVGVAVWTIPSLHHKAANLIAPAPEQQHIAVLPFDNIGSNPENATLTDGLMDSLTGRLSNLDVGNKSLWVVPDSEVRRLKVTDPGAALKKLGANLVVKGSVERDGSDIHLTVNLIDTKDLRQVGSADVEDQAGDLSTLENEAVSRLASLMNISVSADMLRNTGGAVNPAAYEDYLTALGYMHRYDKSGNLDLAITTLGNALKTDPQFALGYAQLGEAYRLKYQVDQDPHWLAEALASCQKAAELDNRVPAVFVTLAQIHDVLGKHDLALQEFHHALDLDPKDAAALIGLARSYESSGRTADAEKTFQNAVAIRPDDWDDYNQLGAFYDRQGKYPQAIAAYRQALQLTPDNAELYSNLAAVYLDQGGQQPLANAEQALRKSVALNPSYPAYANLGLLYLQEKRYAESASATQQALKINGNNYLVWNNLMLAYDASGQNAQAEAARHKTEQLAEDLVKLKPQDSMAQSTLATLYAADNMPDKSLPRIRTSLALAPDDPNVLSNVGEAYEFLGDRKHALEYIEKALRKGYSLDDLKIEPRLQSLVADPQLKLPRK